jgi:hypothetical protein
LIPTAITVGVSRVASGLLCLHAIAITPAGPMELVRSSISIGNGLPCEKVRSAPAIVFSGPARRLLSLWPARSPSRLATLYTESSDSFVASTVVSIATGWSEPVPGRELHPLKSSAFSRRTFSPTIRAPASLPSSSLRALRAAQGNTCPGGSVRQYPSGRSCAFARFQRSCDLYDFE